VSAAPVTAGTESGSPARPRRGRGWFVAKVVLFVILAWAAVQVVMANADELSGAGAYLEHASWGWIGLAAAAEALSYLSFTLLQHRLLLAGGLRVSLTPLGAMSLAGNAISISLPGGTAFATVFAYRQYRRRGADEALATWTLVAFTALTAVTLAALAVFGLAIAGSDSGISGLLPLLALLLIGPATAVAVLLQPRLLAVILQPFFRWTRRVTRFPRRDPTDAVDELVNRLQTVEPRPRDWMAGLFYALGNWIADCACLVFAFRAVGAPVPWRGLLVAYGAAQVAANVPITPGGIGVVEGSLAIGLVAFGGSTAGTVAAVLLYRILSFWVVIPIGWLAWFGLQVDGRRHPIPEGILAAVAVPVPEPGRPDGAQRGIDQAGAGRPWADGTKTGA